jgi:predicted enzyme related to lactoylglutathione lyase
VFPSTVTTSPLRSELVPEVVATTAGMPCDLDKAAAFYSKLLGTDGKRHPGARHYFDCGGVVLAVLDPSRGGLTPTPGPKSLYFAVADVAAVHARAKQLGALAPYKVHGEEAGAVIERPWGETRIR